MTLLTSLVFGLGPAMQTARTSANDLAQIGLRVAGNRRVRRGQQALVIGELALAQVLLVGAGLLLVSFVHATRTDLGFAPSDRVLAEINLVPDYLQVVGDTGLIDPSRKIRFINAVLDRVRGAPGRASGRRLVHRAADRRAESRHPHRRRSAVRRPTTSRTPTSR